MDHSPLVTETRVCQICETAVITDGQIMCTTCLQNVRITIKNVNSVRNALAVILNQVIRSSRDSKGMAECSVQFYKLAEQFGVKTNSKESNSGSKIWVPGETE